MDVTVIIPSYNSEKTLKRCLESAINQSASLEYEIILIDSSPGSAVDKIAENFPQVKFIKSQKKTFPGIARNIGVENAAGELLVFIDADVVIPAGWLEGVFSYYKAGHDVFSGAIDMSDNERSQIIDKLAWCFEFSEYKPRMMEGQRWCLPSCALAVKKSMLNEDRFLNMEYSEDVCLTVRLRRDGNILYFNPYLKVCHISCISFSKLLKKAFNFGVTNIMIRKMHNVSGSCLIRASKLALFIMPAFAFLKFVKVSWRNIRYNYFWDKILYILTFPLMIVVMFSWMLGAYKGLFVPKKSIGKSGCS